MSRTLLLLVRGVRLTNRDEDDEEEERPEELYDELNLYGEEKTGRVTALSIVEETLRPRVCSEMRPPCSSGGM